MSIELKKAVKSDFKLIKPLYLSAFPIEERQPFFMLRRGVKKGSGEIFTAWDKGEFVGFLYLISNDTAGYLFFFAVDKALRGKGYGSEILGELRKIYEGRKLFLAREQLDRTAENYDERVRRHSFYLKNGFIDLPVKIKEMSVTYDVMGTREDVSTEDYDKLISDWCGSFIKKLLHMEMTK